MSTLGKATVIAPDGRVRQGRTCRSRAAPGQRSRIASFDFDFDSDDPVALLGAASRPTSSSVRNLPVTGRYAPAMEETPVVFESGESQATPDAPGSVPPGGITLEDAPGSGPLARITSEEETALRDACTRFLIGNGVRTAAEMLSDITSDTEKDNYGVGGVVAELET